MEKGAEALVKILAAALALGVLTSFLHPWYRAAFRDHFKGHPEHSPIWQSNASYYALVGPARAKSAISGEASTDEEAF